MKKQQDSGAEVIEQPSKKDLVTTSEEETNEDFQALDEKYTQQLEEYRKHLIQAEQKAQEDFDKTLLSLSSGALGISFAFLKNIVGPGPHEAAVFLVSSWFCWGLSVACVLASYFMSQKSLRRAIQQIDNDEALSQDEQYGGGWAKFTVSLNILGGVLFLVGVFTMGTFVYHNMEF